MCIPTPNMLKSAWKNAAQRNALKEFHIHIYDNGKQGENMMLAQHIAQTFPKLVTGIYAIGVVGPHRRKNIELNIKSCALASGELDQIRTLIKNSKIPTLLHPNTGDDFADHLLSAEWLNEDIGFRNAFFDSIKGQSPKV